MSSWFDWSAWVEWMSPVWGGAQSAAGLGTVILIGILLVVLAVLSWMTNAFSLPGNWGVVLLAVVAAIVPTRFAADHDGTMLVDWPVIVVLLALAGLGEFLETVAGAAGAAKKGAARRSMLLALVGAMTGSILGATMTIPIPIVGPLIGAVLGGAAGAFGGAYLGEAWKGTAHEDRVAIGSAAFTGKIAGTAAKIFVGAVMCAVFAVALVF